MSETRPPLQPATASASKATGGRERRLQNRARADWPLTLNLPGGTCGALLRDISTAGLCFYLDRPIPEMTVLGVELYLPDAKLPGLRHKLTGRGAVVRCERISPRVEHFEIAVYLHEISNEDRALIAAHVQAGGGS